MSTSKPWADGPLPLLKTPSATRETKDHTAHYIANEMAFAHNAMIRGLNALYLQAIQITSGDVKDFLFFAASWAAWIMHHHNLEETQMFPEFEKVPGVKSGSLQHNIEQHHGFAADLEALHKYSTTVASEKYDGKELRRLIDIFAKSLHEHLAEEIDTLWAMDSVPADSPESQKLLEIYRYCEAEASKQDKQVVPPLILGMSDKTFQGGNDWPKLPLGSAYIVHYLLGRKHRGAWRFLPCDTWGQPRDLPFASKADSAGFDV